MAVIFILSIYSLLLRLHHYPENNQHLSEGSEETQLILIIDENRSYYFAEYPHSIKIFSKMFTATFMFLK